MSRVLPPSTRRRIAVLAILTSVLASLPTPAAAEGVGTLVGRDTLRVVTVPWSGNPNLSHVVFPGGTLVLQGVAHLPAGCSLASATWDPGDGSPAQAVPTTDPWALELSHVYGGEDGTPYVAVLTVTDSCGNSASDTFRVRVREKTLDVEVNLAIDRGLWAQHKRIVRATIGAVDSGSWTGQHAVSATASAVQAFEVHGHRPDGDAEEDPYVDDVRRGLAYLTSQLGSIPIAAQTWGNPDSNGNLIGLQVTLLYQGVQRPIYLTGQVIDALVASKSPDSIALTGPADVLGRSYRSIVEDLLDAYSWGQIDSGSAEGGWRYLWHDGQADNSAAQWWAIGAIAAARVEGFKIPIPPFVTSENLKWLTASQVLTGSISGTHGQFGYTTSTSTVDALGAVNTTPSGMVQLDADGVLSSDNRFVSAARYVNRSWANLTSSGHRLYGIFALSKALRLATPAPSLLADGNAVEADGVHDSFDWYRAEVARGAPKNGIARYLVGVQQSTGAWTSATWVTAAGVDIATAWALICLSSIIEEGPIAHCDADPETTGVGVPIEFDGTSSLHSDPLHQIVLYEWDFDEDGVFDATGPVVQHSFATLGDHLVLLRVTDDNDPPLTDTDTCTIHVVPPPIPPNADPGGPYTFCLGSTQFVLDGSGSSDPDGQIIAYAWDFDPQPLDLDFDDATGPTYDAVAYFSTLPPGIYDVGLRVVDNDQGVNTDFTTVVVTAPPDCDLPPDLDCSEVPVVELWPPNHHYVEIDLAKLVGVAGSDGQAATIAITAITQDEPVDDTGDGSTTCDGYGLGTSVAHVRAERSGQGNGRVYRIAYLATHPLGGSCNGSALVTVPHSQNGMPAVDDGQSHDSTQGCP